jgi:hypothetical protein
MGEFSFELILLIVDFLPGLVAPRCRSCWTELGEQLLVLFTALTFKFCIILVCAELDVITTSVTSKV